MQLVGGGDGTAGPRVAVENAEINVRDFVVQIYVAGRLVEVRRS